MLNDCIYSNIYIHNYLATKDVERYDLKFFTKTLDRNIRIY